MSVPQFRKADISQLPRLVVLRTVCKSGTCLMAFSSGLVTVTIILFTGCRPSSAMILILGKVISGNREVCSFEYTNSPLTIISANTKLSGFLCDIKKFPLGVILVGAITVQFLL